MIAPLTVEPGNIPSALKARRQWVLWKSEEQDGKKTKVPYQKPINKTDYKASTASPSTWGHFDELWTYYDTLGGYSGVAFVISANDPYTGIDLDHCVDQEGNIEPWAQNIIDRLDSYTEISPSGTGIRIFVKGEKPGSRCRTGQFPNFEIYNQLRLLSLTGNHLPGTPTNIQKRQEELDELYTEIFPEKIIEIEATPGKSSMEDGTILGRILGSKQADEFEALWDGDILDHPSTSEADLSFCNILAFWTGRDEGQMDRLFRSSRRYRPKWDEKRGRQTYGEKTISKAITDTAEVYTPVIRGQEAPNAEVLDLDEVSFIDDKGKRKFSPDKAARSVLKKFKVVTTPDEKIWVYQDGIFEPIGDYVIGKALDIAGDLSSIHMKRETLAKVRLRTREEYDVFDLDHCLFPVQNGIIDLRRGLDGFKSHSPEYRRTWKAPVTFDPKAVCPEIKKYLSTSLDEDGRKTLIDIMAAKLTAYNFPYFSPWVGRGRNGKRLATEIIRGIWGDPQITEVEIHKFHERRFDQIEVKGRHFIINNEVPRTATKGFDWVKKISGGDPITADVKGRDQIQFRPHAFLIYDCNNPPRIDDYTKAIEERIAPIWWNYSFVDKPDTTDPRERKRDPHLEGRITSPSELSGFLNILLQEVPRLIETRAIHRPGTGKELAASYDLKADHLAIFWDKIMIFEPDSVTSSTHAFELYRELCIAIEVSPVSLIIFNRYGRKRGFKDGRPYFTSDDGLSVRARGWYDCTLDEEELEDLIHPSRPDGTDGTGRGRSLDRKNRHAGTERTDIHTLYSISENKENSNIENHIGGNTTKKSVQSVPPSLDIDSSNKTRPIRDVDGTDLEKPRTSKIEMLTPTKEGSSWKKVSGGGDLSRGLKKLGGRLTADDMVNSFGWEPSKVKFTFDLLESQYGWTRDKLVSGLVVFKPPAEAV